MTSQTLSAGQVAHGHSLLAPLAQRIAEAWAAHRERVAVRRLCDRLELMDDRMLLDIGVSETDIARLRSGERFVPSPVQM